MALTRVDLATEPDFPLGALEVSPSTCRVKVGDQEIRVEAQTMTVLVALARANGSTLGRDALTETCWNGRIVSDDAITRTIAKIRAIVRGVDPAPFTLETLPRIGYRLIVHGPALGDAAVAAADVLAARPARSWFRLRTIAAVAVVAIAIPLGWIALPHDAAPGPLDASGQSSALPGADQVAEALVLLDRERVLGYLERGWNPNWKLDSEGGDALQTLLLACERNATHNRGMVAKIARDLVLAGADAGMKNKWGDTALDIARSPRYCGPRHPVVDFLQSMTPEPPS